MCDMRIVYKEEIMEVTRILLEMRNKIKNESIMKYKDPKYKALEIALDGVGCLPFEK